MRRQAIAVVRAATLLAAAVLTQACAEAPPGGRPIDREVFVETYVELRLAALESDTFVVTPEQRDEILTRHGVSEERLLHFAEVHGQDTDLMNEVWAEIDRRLEERIRAEEAAA